MALTMKLTHLLNPPDHSFASAADVVTRLPFGGGLYGLYGLYCILVYMVMNLQLMVLLYPSFDSISTKLRMIITSIVMTHTTVLP